MDDSEYLITVLVIDDEKAMLHELSRMLRARGLGVETCRNGTQAMELLHRRSVDAVLTDLVMEGLVGTALLQQIRNCPGGRYIPVVFMSSMPEQRVRAAVEGDYAFIRKPFSFDRLMQVIDDATAELAQGAPGSFSMSGDSNAPRPSL